MISKHINQGINFQLRRWGINTLVFFYMTLNSFSQTHQFSNIEKVLETFTANDKANLTTKILLNKDQQSLGGYEAIIIYNPKVMIVNTSQGNHGIEIERNGFLNTVDTKVSGRIRIRAMHKQQEKTGKNLQTLIVHWKVIGRGNPFLKVNIHRLTDLEQSGIDYSGDHNNDAIIEGLINILPKVSITAPANHSVYKGVRNILIEASALDFDGTIKEVSFYQGNEFLGKDTSFPYSLNWANFSNGDYQLTARAIDNQGGLGISKVVHVRVRGIVGGNIFPKVSISAPVNGKKFSAGSTIIITANASDPDGRVESVSFYNGNNLLETDKVSPYTHNWTNVPAGKYRLTAKAIDNRGAQTISAPVNITVKSLNKRPSVGIIYPAQGSRFTEDDDIPIEAKASDPDGSIKEVSFYRGNNPNPLGTVTSSPYRFIWKKALGGAHKLSAKAVDDKGASNTSPIVNIIVNFLPTVEIIFPVNRAVFTAGDIVYIDIAASDRDGQIVKVDLYSNNIYQSTDSIPPYQFRSSQGVPVGKHALFVKATDNQGAFRTSKTVNIVVEPADDQRLRLQYHSLDNNGNLNHFPISSQKIMTSFNIINHSGEAIPLHELTIRYWYTIDEERMQKFYCNYAEVGRRHITGRFQRSSAPNDQANYYLEVGFTSNAGILKPQKNTGRIEVYFQKVNYSIYHQHNDYSFETPEINSVSQGTVTLYRGGKLIWGNEPSTTSASMDLNTPQVAGGFRLSQNYPNPFNPKTAVLYQLPENSRVILEIYDITGHKVRTLVDKFQETGEHRVVWDALDNLGRKVSSGIYIYRIQVIGKHKHFIDSKKMLLMK